MSEIPTPRQTLELLGHEAAERIFLESWNSGRMAHAWLICGPRGIGKASFAYRAARFILAEGEKGAAAAAAGPALFGDLPRPKPAGLAIPADHPVVRRVAANGHADLKVVERAFDPDKKRLRGEIVIEDVRGIGSFFSLTAAEGGWRVVILDAADEMNRNAANAVLKILEEPPKRAILLLIAHAPGRLLPTIRSRCRKLNLKPLDEPVILDLLARHKPDLADGDRRALARLAEGSIGRALSLAEEGGLDLFRDMIAVLADLPKLDILRLHRFAEQVSKRDAEDSTWGAFVDLLGWWQARLVRAGTLGVEPILAEEGPLLARLAGRVGADRWVEMWEKNARLFAQTDGLNLDRKHAVLDAFLNLERAAG